MDVDIYYKQLKSMNPRQLLTQLFAFGTCFVGFLVFAPLLLLGSDAVSIVGMIVASALIVWKSLMLVTGNEVLFGFFFFFIDVSSKVRRAQSW
jgi:hypothetical protein